MSDKPIPWQIAPDSRGLLYFIEDSNHQPVGRIVSREAAELILRAVNSHDALEAAVEWVLNADEMVYCDCYISEGIGEDDPCTGKCVHAALVAALKLAEGREANSQA